MFFDDVNGKKLKPCNFIDVYDRHPMEWPGFYGPLAGSLAIVTPLITVIIYKVYQVILFPFHFSTTEKKISLFRLLKKYLVLLAGI